ILPTTPRSSADPSSVLSWRLALEEAGHRVEVLIGSGPAVPSPPEIRDASGRIVIAPEPVLAAAAFAGLWEADGDVLLVLDPAMGYAPGDLVRVVERLEGGEADLAIASRFLADPGAARRPLRAAIGALARHLTGTSDPLSGLIGLTRALFLE